MAKVNQYRKTHDMEAFSPWTLFVDIGIISLLLLTGKLMRVKIKWIQNVFKWGFLERINKLDPYFELFHAINKLERSRNLLDKRIHISYNQHSLLFLERKQFA